MHAASNQGHGWLPAATLQLSPHRCAEGMVAQSWAFLTLAGEKLSIRTLSLKTSRLKALSNNLLSQEDQDYFLKRRSCLRAGARS